MLERLTDRIYYMKNDDVTDRPILGLVIGDKYSLIVDSGNSPKHANEFKKAIGMMDLPPLKYLVLTHHHWDHTFGLQEWDLVSVASHKTCELMKVYKEIKFDDKSLQLAKDQGILSDFSMKSIKAETTERENFLPQSVDLSFDGDVTIDLGGITCELRQVISPHTDDSTIIYIPEEKTLFLGDCVYGRNIKGHYCLDDKLLFPLLQLIEEYDAKHYLISHESVFNREGILTYGEQLKICFNIAYICSSLEVGLVEYKKQYGVKPSEEVITHLKSFGLR